MSTEKQTLVVYGDGVNDDSDAIQAFLDGKARLIHVDGSPYQWPGTPGRRYAIGKALHLGGARRDTTAQAMPLKPGAWIGVR